MIFSILILDLQIIVFHVNRVCLATFGGCVLHVDAITDVRQQSLQPLLHLLPQQIVLVFVLHAILGKTIVRPVPQTVRAVKVLS